MQANTWLLKNRYQLKRLLDKNEACETWLAEDDRTNPFLIKVWNFTLAEGDELSRALWNAELRRIYRISSTPGAEQHLVVIHDAGVDRDNNCFVLIMKRELDGFERLSDLLLHRSSSGFTWLSQEQESRQRIWEGLVRIAQGVNILHSQNVLHRNLSPENIYVHSEIGPESFRISGFEWSIRIGELAITSPAFANATLPPEAQNLENFGYQPDTDWYAFGILSIRCLMNIEPLLQKTMTLGQRNHEILTKIEGETNRYLSDREKTLLHRLIDPNPNNRLLSSQGNEIIRAIGEIIDALRYSSQDRSRPLLLTYNPETHLHIVEAALENGFVPNPGNDERFEPHNPLHVNNLSAFIQSDMQEGLIYNHGDRFIIVGQRLSFRITQWQDIESGKRTWDAAIIQENWGLRRSDTEPKELPLGSVIVRTQREVRQRKNTELAQSQSWSSHLPQRDRSFALRAQLSQFHNFIRCTNQIELLLADATLFQYEVVHTKQTEDSRHEVVIREIKRSRPVLSFLETDNGLIEFLQRERERSDNPSTDRVSLTEHSSLNLRNTRNAYSRIEETDCYTIININEQYKTVTLARQSGIPNQLPFPSGTVGWLRTYGMIGQIELIRRRKEAIDRLNTHSYLLKSLCVPRDVYIDIGEYQLPRQLSADIVDTSKQAVMQDVLRTRPIYTLQGPPGTGKTTMVAYLLGQIFEEDFAAQVLITAQAHTAVDVLRNKVQEIFTDHRRRHQPLTIRLGRGRRLSRNREAEPFPDGSVEKVAMTELERSVEALAQLEQKTQIQTEWGELARTMFQDIRNIERRSDEMEFIELVKRSANITFSTTSAGDLEELAGGSQYYDWSIIEEAGKCHGFDLALPMQAGHRWLLIGDQFQLPPYRFNDYDNALGRLNDVAQELRNLPDLPFDLLDYEWLTQWRALEPEDRETFSRFAKDWLKTFDSIFKQCENGTYHGEAHQTVDESIGAIAGMLSKQYRMHPTIGNLVSRAFYQGRIENRTVNEHDEPQSRVIAPISEPSAIPFGVGIVWIDTPDCYSGNNVAAEIGPLQGEPRFSNPYEVNIIASFLRQLQLEQKFVQQGKHIEVAVLAPYNQQASMLRRKLNPDRGFNLNQGMVNRRELSSRSGDNKTRLVHTVDSFQGNEADIVIVSLVRNNRGTEIGFLREHERMNVLMSRAQRLLVLVGSWEFFERVVAPIPENEDRAESHLKRSIGLLREWFTTGEAVKVPANLFLG